MQIFVDMDGVLANFDAHHETIFGVRPDRVADNVDWLKVRAATGFFANIPPMPDAFQLWDYVKPRNPIVLTGVPPKVTEAAENKRGWVR